MTDTSSSKAEFHSWIKVSASIAIAVGVLVALLIHMPRHPLTWIVGGIVIAFALAMYLNPSHWLRRRSATCLTIAGACVAMPLLEGTFNLGTNFAPWFDGQLRFATSASPWVAAIFGSLSIAFARMDRMPVTQKVVDELVDIRDKQTTVLEEVKRGTQLLLEEIRNARPPDVRADPAIERDLVEAVKRLASAADRGEITAQNILRNANPGDFADYLAARRSQLDGGQKMLNERIDDEKITLDRQLAAVTFTIGRIDEAEHALQRILALRPDDVDSINRLGIIYHLRGRLDEAEAAYHRVLELSGDDPAGQAISYGNLGLILRARGELDGPRGAEAMHRKALAINKKLDRLEGMTADLSNLALIMQTRGDLKEAEKMLRKALKISQQISQREYMANQYGNLGNILFARDDLEGAKLMCRKAIGINDELGRRREMADDYVKLGFIAEQQGHLEGPEGAQALWTTSRDIYKEIGDTPMVEQVQGYLLRLEMRYAYKRSQTEGWFR